jgi:hypothetical protein
VACAFMAMRYHTKHIGLHVHSLLFKRRKETQTFIRVYTSHFTGRMLQLAVALHMATKRGKRFYVIVSIFDGSRLYMKGTRRERDWRW